MSDNEGYNGWKNQETWAFNLHWSNDEGLYNETLERAKEWMADNEEDAGYDFALGEYIIEYWKDLIDGWEKDLGSPMPHRLEVFYREVGSWWRVDEREIGASVRESLS